MRIDKAQIERIASSIREMMGEDFDTDTFLDTLDGETDVLDIIDWLLRKRSETVSVVAAIKAEEGALRARRKRYETRETSVKKSLQAILRAMDMVKIERPLATVSRRSGHTNVVIRDARDVPTQLCRITRTPDKAVILKILKAGEAVPGAELETGDETISIRVK